MLRSEHNIQQYYFKENYIHNTKQAVRYIRPIFVFEMFSKKNALSVLWYLATFQRLFVLKVFVLIKTLCERGHVTIVLY